MRIKHVGQAAVFAALLGACVAVATAAIPFANVRPQHWSRQSAAQLLQYVDQIGEHGLEPADYQRDRLSQAIQMGDADQLEQQASQTFALAARDLAEGHVRPDERRQFSIAKPALEAQEIAILIDQALAAKDVARVLDDLAPSNSQYAALRKALATLPPGASEERRKLVASLERWRWLPAAFGVNHILVNIPEYRARVTIDGISVASHRVIVGKTSSPTPQFVAAVTSVVLNPAWSVPQSIIAESIGKLIRSNPRTARVRGFSWSTSGRRLNVVQGPGKGNALGQMKLEMPNGFSVYLHDTPNKELFDKPDRDLSHGCIRTDRALDLASELLGWTRGQVDGAVASGRTQRLALPHPMPVYVLYFTAYAGPDGAVEYFGDPYRLDPGIYDAIKRG